jgi:hypothetical protein
MSFLRHEEICRPMSSVPGRSYPDRPRPPRFDEFPAGYSLAGCAPALPASASPAEAHRGARRSSCTIEKQRTVGSVLTVCLTQGDKPSLTFGVPVRHDAHLRFGPFSLKHLKQEPKVLAVVEAHYSEGV